MRLKKLFPDTRCATSGVVAARVLVIILMLANLSFIWFNSSKTAGASTKSSNSVTRSIAPVVIDGYEELSKKEQKEKVIEFDPKIRTAAHMLEYVPLGVLIFLLMTSVFNINPKSKKNTSLAILSFLLALIFALTDEVHQIFVDGRSFEFKDICMDMSGMVLGFVLVAIPFAVYKKYKNADA